MSPKKVWEPDEDAILCKWYPSKGTRYCENKLPRWTFNQIRHRIMKLHLRLNEGVKKEVQRQQTNRRAGARQILVDAAIRQRGIEHTASEMAVALGVKKHYIANRARRLGVQLIHQEASRRTYTRKTNREWMEEHNNAIERLALFLPWCGDNSWKEREI